MTTFRKSLMPLARLASAALIAVAVACSSDSFPTAPTASPPASADPSLLGDLFGAADQLLFCPTSQTYTATQTIGSEGGTIVVGPHSLTVPAGALSSPVAITATAPAGDYLRVEFEPHGLWFDGYATLRMSYADCGLLTLVTGKIVYVDDNLNILETVASSNDIWRRRITGRIRHFSSYALAF
jgi:hypothetical protein